MKNKILIQNIWNLPCADSYPISNNNFFILLVEKLIILNLIHIIIIIVLIVIFFIILFENPIYKPFLFKGDNECNETQPEDSVLIIDDNYKYLYEMFYTRCQSYLVLLVNNVHQKYITC